MEKDESEAGVRWEDLRGTSLPFLAVVEGRAHVSTRGDTADRKRNKVRISTQVDKQADNDTRLTFLSLATLPNDSNRCLCCLLLRILEYCFAFTYSGSSSCSSRGKILSSISVECDCLVAVDTWG